MLSTIGFPRHNSIFYFAIAARAANFFMLGNPTPYHGGAKSSPLEQMQGDGANAALNRAEGPTEAKRPPATKPTSA